MKILYFADMRHKLGRAGERLCCPEGVNTVGDLVAYLRGRGNNYEKAFADMAGVRVAVNYEYSDLSCCLSDNDEVAFFPPVTGG